MRKLCILLTFILIALTLPVSVQAAGDSSTSLVIDNKNIYEGMDKAYNDGYTMSVKDGKATVVLPLIAKGEIKGNAITATPGLGDTATSPFVFKNYQKTVNLSNCVISGGATVAAYLVRFELSLAPGRTNGVYPVTMNIQAQGAEGNFIEQTFTSYVTITDGKNPSSANTQDQQKQTSQPKVIVSGYTINPSLVSAGEEFTATVTLKNTSTTKEIQNMTVTISCDSPKLSLKNDSNTIFIDKLGIGKTKDITIKYKSDIDTPPQGYNISLAMAYDNTEAASLTSAGSFTVMVNQPLKVEMEMPHIADEVNAGDTLPLSFQIMNMGRSKVYNVRCELNAPGLISSGTAFIGNMEAGTTGVGKMEVFIGTKDMSKEYAGKDKYGLTEGKAKLIYEDSSGKEYTQEVAFSTKINEPVISTNNDEQKKEEKKAGQWWVSILIGCVIIAGLLAVTITYRKKEHYHEDI